MGDADTCNALKGMFGDDAKGDFMKLDFGSEVEEQNPSDAAGSTQVKNDPTEIEKLKKIVTRNSQDFTKARQIIRRSVKKANANPGPTSTVILGKLEGWEDIMDSADEFHEGLLDPTTDWTYKDLAKIKTQTNSDIRRVQGFMSALKLLEV